MTEEKSKIRKAILVDFPKNVRKRRHELEMTQEELAEKADFHVNYIGGIERAQRNPSLESIVYLAKALNVSPKDLIPD
jgi:transcriptional regulator with XRE-family HTH domain